MRRKFGRNVHTQITARAIWSTPYRAGRNTLYLQTIVEVVYVAPPLQ